MSSNSYGDPETRTRILTATHDLVLERGPRFTLSDVAQRAGVSRQAVYLHFTDRAGLLVALVQHMDEVLELDVRLAEVFDASSSGELIERTMRLNTEFWTTVAPVARVLESVQHDDDALGAAWRDRMGYRLMAFTAIVERIAAFGDLAPEWTTERAAALLYSVAHFEPWRELTSEMGWDHDSYVADTTLLLRRALLS